MMRGAQVGIGTAASLTHAHFVALLLHCLRHKVVFGHAKRRR